MRTIPEKDASGGGVSVEGFAVASLLLLGLYAVIAAGAYCMGAQSVQRDAVKHGVARFVATDLGYTRFEWKEINNGK